MSTTNRFSPAVNTYMDSAVAENARVASAVMAGLFGVYSVLHWFLLLPPSNAIMAVMALASAILFLSTYIYLRNHEAPPGSGHAIFFGLLLIALINSLSHLWLTQDPEQTTNFMLITIAAGIFMFSHLWFAITNLLVFVVWQVVFTPLNSPLYSHYSIALAASILLSATVHFIRARAQEEAYEFELSLQEKETRLSAAQVDIAAQKERYQKLTEAMFEGIAIHDGGKITEANETAAEIFGYTQDEMIGMPVLNFVAPQAQEATLQTIASGRELPYETLGIRKTGEPFPMEISARELVLQGKRLRVAVFRDISERERLRGERERFFRLSKDMLVIADFEGYFRQVSPVMTEILGYTEDELTSHPFVDFMPEDEQEIISEHMATLRQGGEVASFQNRMVTKDGKTLWILWNAVALLSEDLIYAVGKNITEMRTQQMSERIAAQRLQAEVELAAEIQSNLLPKDMPKIPGFEIAAYNLPAHYISGDLYDTLPLKDGGLQIAIADIAGKGMSAGMLTVTTRTILRHQKVVDVPLNEFLAQVEEQLYEELSDLGLLITLFIGRLRPNNPCFSYISTGHGEALHHKALSVELVHLPASGPPLGVIPEGAYTKSDVFLWPGDLILLYSDGIPEAMDEGGNFYSFQRLAAILHEKHMESPETLIQTITADIKIFRGNAEISDDVTLLAVRVEPYQVEEEFTTKLENLNVVIDWFKTYWSGLPAQIAYDLELATFELLVNIFKHGYQGREGNLHIKISLQLESFTLTLQDQSQPFLETAIPEESNSELRESGYGFKIINTIFDEFTHTAPPGGGNLWVATKQLRLTGNS